MAGEPDEAEKPDEFEFEKTITLIKASVPECKDTFDAAMPSVPANVRLIAVGYTVEPGDTEASLETKRQQVAETIKTNTAGKQVLAWYMDGDDDDREVEVRVYVLD